jgi:hypothetical protein
LSINARQLSDAGSGSNVHPMPQLTPELNEAFHCIVLSTEWHEGGTIHLAPPRLQTKIGLQDQDLKDCLGNSETASSHRQME